MKAHIFILQSRVCKITLYNKVLSYIYKYKLLKTIYGTESQNLLFQHQANYLQQSHLNELLYNP